MAGQIILEDGSIQGKMFSEKKFEYPHPMRGKETYEEYHNRIDEMKKEGFHPGDLSQNDWATYCMGSGSYEGVDSNTIIGE